MQDDIAQIHRWFDDDDLGAVRKWATNYRTEVEGYSAEQIEQLAAEGFPDDSTSQTHFRAYTESVRSALEPGTEGIIDDGIAFHSSWGFEVGAIGAPVRLWSGPADLHVPLAHSRWLAAQLRGAALDASGSGGHLEIIAPALPVAHRWLAGQRWTTSEVSQASDPTEEAPCRPQWRRSPTDTVLWDSPSLFLCFTALM
jgi:hypothetical protein